MLSFYPPNSIGSRKCELKCNSANFGGPSAGGLSKNAKQPKISIYYKRNKVAGSHYVLLRSEKRSTLRLPHTFRGVSRPSDVARPV